MGISGYGNFLSDMGGGRSPDGDAARAYLDSLSPIISHDVAWLLFQPPHDEAIAQLQHWRCIRDISLPNALVARAEAGDGLMTP